MHRSNIELEVRDVRTVVEKTGRLVPNEKPGRLLGWQEVGYFDMEPRNITEIYRSALTVAHKQGVSKLLA